MKYRGILSPRDCPLCGAPLCRLFLREGHWITTCAACAHHCAEVEPRPDHAKVVYEDRYFQDGGPGYPGYLQEGTLLLDSGKRYAKLLAGISKPGTVLDVGAAGGFVLKGFIESGWDGRGIEPNEGMARHARSVLGLAVDTGILEEIDAARSYDLITMLQVVGHFPDPLRALTVAARITRPGGHWLIETWDRRSWAARVFGRHWHAFSPPSVLHWFSAKSLTEVAERLGFRLVARGRPVKWVSGAHAKSILTHRLGPRIARPIKLIPDRARLPYPGDDLFWAVYRKDKAA